MNISSKAKRIQSLLVNYLLKFGKIEILLPNEIKLEIDITEVDREGNVSVSDNYCSIMAIKGNRVVALDPYTVSLQFEDDKHLVLEDVTYTEKGDSVKYLSVV